ncbi:hypothetical protein CU098_004419, partial [Rhizopus stolonifer]
SVLAPEELHAMACGLSSILNISSNSQKSFSTSEQWKKLQRYFISKYALPKIDSSNLESTWDLACTFCEMDGNIYRPMNFLATIRTSNNNIHSDYKKYLLLEHVLQVVQDESRLLSILFCSNSQELESVNENDIVTFIWAPIFNKILKLKQLIHLETGETITKYSSVSKQDLYRKKNIAGFKFDFRALNVKNGFEVDFAACEVSKNAMKSKLFHDNSKVVREAKNALDFIHILTGHKCNDSLYSWVVQISDLQCKLSTMHLARNSLYVSVPQFEFSFPKDISELENFLDIYACINTFVVNGYRKNMLMNVFDFTVCSINVKSC